VGEGLRGKQETRGYMRNVAFVLLSLCLNLAATTLIEIKPPLKNRSSRHARVQGYSGVADSANLRIIEIYGKLPLSFEANQGQTDSQVKFLSQGRGYSLFLTSTEAVLSLRKPEAGPAPEGPTVNSRYAPGIRGTPGFNLRNWVPSTEYRPSKGLTDRRPFGPRQSAVQSCKRPPLPPSSA